MTSKLFAVIALVVASVSLSAAAFEGKGYHDSKQDCITAVENKTAVVYTPKVVNNLTEKAGWTKKLSGKACVLADTVAGKRWVHIDDLAIGEKSGELKMWQCSNRIYEIVYLERAVVAKKEVVQLVEAPVVQTVVAKPAEKVVLTATAETKCDEKCVATEKATQVKVEARSDNKCIAKTNVGYAFEVRAARNGKLMVALVNPDSGKMIANTKATYVPGEQGSTSCEADRAKLLKHWNEVKKAYGLPSVCSLAEM